MKSQMVISIVKAEEYGDNEISRLAKDVNQSVDQLVRHRKFTFSNQY
ncbi:hypothetical protein OK016_25930 [Vibrio chagasii]|nr:hypothetical protein [Vibrio chagasii]